MARGTLETRERLAAERRTIDLREGEYAPELSSKYLPPAPYEDLPEPLPLRKIIGPSVILLATSLGSGEFVLWPFISSQIGLGLVWLASIGILTQYFLNMEIERYTLATGETAVTGFTRFWKGWAALFIMFALFPNIWPGWATGASTTLTFVLGGGNIEVITIAFLIAIGIALTASPVVYQFVEKFQMVMVGTLILFMIGAIVIATDASSWGSTVTDAGFLGPIRELDDAALLLGAIAFAGMGGAGNLVQSNWIRDKGLGMGGHMPRVVSPLTGDEVSIPTTGFMFRQTEGNMRRWREWWRVANHEQFWIFFAVGLLSIIVMSVLTVSTVGVGENLGEDLDFIRAEGEALRDIIGPGFGVVFWVAGTVFLLSTNLGILDYCGRLIADVAKVNWFKDSAFWSESKIYFAVIWAMILSGAVILMSGMNEPVTLLTIASASGGVVMFIYSALLILLNRKALPDAIKVRGVRLGALIWAVLFYGAASTYLIVNVVIPELTG
jgi:hypothetical protein